MAHTIEPGQHAEGKKNEVRDVTIVLSVLTIVELILGYVMYKWIQEEGFLRGFIKGVIIILMLAKAFYIVSYFMHLGHEIKNLIMTIVVPLGLFFWFIIAFLYDGNSFKNNRLTYDRYKQEKATKKVEKTHHSAEEGTHEAPKTHETQH
jgi:cytochrome c oxidase subunit IV